ncbi:RtcB family protein [Methanothermobacter tenebrarum]|uniref:tRNA-splicing ligase RtcB n=1 Tax=Methanothermobacter tenebrarum TaxID=680118 RepID=A0A328PGW7_9EURY|nr:RtcB family protein [Methanothermobacter tenebrarum]MBC7101083.1 RtcB family protein [Methanobacteriales archaeon]MBC7117693.1 RtcB family protein [Methanobacteriaceae archaeon]NPV64141.1 RtcB family protein [Methanobacteriaceae archaeon]RAO79762.1 RNA-splicing ligase RtcB [Methanothermobacter tenebrarum]
MNVKNILIKVRESVWEVPTDYKECMRVPGRIYLDEEALKDLEKGAIDQVANVACLPGIQKFSIGLPDIHFGYGFSIGGVAAFDARNGIISPGGVGFDINCGVRLLKTNLDHEEVKPRIKELIDTLFRNVPSGVGSKGKIRLKEGQIDEVLENGAEWAVENGYGWEEDLKHLEENGKMEEADATKVSEKAKKRGIPQLGSLGSGNHFLEVQRIDRIFNEKAAKAYGLETGKVTVLIHTGSRGCGHQICSDYLKIMDKAYKKYNIKIPDRQLACAPVDSEEAIEYFQAMAAAANYAWANRQMIVHWVRESFEQVFNKSAEDMEMEILYDVAHNIAKKETHPIKGLKREVYVHRKGATRAFGPGRKEIPSEYRKIGQPVIIPGTMGTSSYVLHGTETAMKETFGSTAHGAGRKMSRAGAKRTYRGEQVQRNLSRMGIYVRATSMPVIAEEAPGAYKDVDMVVNTSHRTGISRLVAKMIPLGVAKG